MGFLRKIPTYRSLDEQHDEPVLGIVADLLDREAEQAFLTGRELTQRRHGEVQQRDAQAGRKRAQQRLEAFGFADDFAAGEPAGLLQLDRAQGGITTQQQAQDEAHRAYGILRSLAKGGRNRAAEADGILDLEIARQRPRLSSRQRRRDRRSRDPGDADHFTRSGFDGRDIGNDAVERRIDTTDTFENRRVRREKRLHETTRGGEEQMLGFEVGFGSLPTRPREAGDLLQGRGQPERIARELDRGGVGEVFALPGDRSLDELREEDAAQADQDDHEADECQRQGVLLAVGIGTEAHADEEIAQLGEGGQAGDGADDPDAQAHVSVADMAELVGDHSLKLVARQIAERAARHADGGILRIVARGEGVDGLVAVDDEAERHRQTGRESHLLHDIQIAAFGGIGRARGHQPAAEAHRDGAPALGQLHDAQEAAADDDGQGQTGRQAEELGLEPVVTIGVEHDGRTPALGRGDPEVGQVDRDHIKRTGQDEDRQHEQHDQLGRASAGLILGPEEIHRAGHGPRSAAQNDTFGAAFSAGSSILKNSPAAKPKALAMKTCGKTSRPLL